jgi:2-polyprenyl-3-methyl-5-hydroxy-6-metoxy-1,4-benzoquinol methylase
MYIQNILNCLVCNDADFDLYLENINHTCGILKTLNINEKIDSNIYKCKNCGHLFLSPVLKDELIANYYNEISSEYFNYEPIHSRINEDKKILNRIQKIKQKGKVLEIGCGNGFFLKLFKDCGYDCTGIEPSPKAFNYAKEYNTLNVINGFLEENTFEKESFDIVLLMDVIEHLYSPNDIIKLCNKILKEGGILVILTGNVNSLNSRLWGSKWYYLYSWEHISFFNKTSISKLLNIQNFKILQYNSISHTGGLIYNIIRFSILNPLMYVYNFWIKGRYKHISLSFDHMLVIAEK